MSDPEDNRAEWTLVDASGGVVRRNVDRSVSWSFDGTRRVDALAALHHGVTFALYQPSTPRKPFYFNSAGGYIEMDNGE